MMAEKNGYTVHRSMVGDGREYVRGDVRQMTEADAATMLKTGAVSLVGKAPAEPVTSVVHTFGAAPNHSDVDGTNTRAKAELASVVFDPRPARRGK